jgi:hypothetical protein
MRQGSLIDDVYVNENYEFGPPICFSNSDIRRMLSLAEVGKNDVFYDLGSGYGQSIIIALTEFGVKRAVGFELQKNRREKSIERLLKWGKKREDITRDRWEILSDNFHKLLFDRLDKDKASFEEATVLFYGLETFSDYTRRISKGWKNVTRVPRRLVYYRNCLFPEIMADEVDSPFLVSKFPFKPTTNKIAWLSKVTGKSKSSLVKDGLPSESELWDDLKHDYDVDRDTNDVSDYRRRLSRAVRANSK